MKLILLATTLIAAAPMAHAQGGCDLVNKIVNAAPGGFAEQKGEEIDDGWFESKVYLTGAEECGVDLSKGNQFYCVWSFENPAAANTKAVMLSEAAKLCLTGWTLEDTTGQQSTNNLKIIKGVSLTGAGDNKGTRVNVFAESYLNSQESLVTMDVRR